MKRAARMGAQQQGRERSSEDGSAAARMGAQQPGWERSSQDGIGETK